MCNLVIIWLCIIVNELFFLIVVQCKNILKLDKKCPNIIIKLLFIIFSSLGSISEWVIIV